jgi:hypothetical protein
MKTEQEIKHHALNSTIEISDDENDDLDHENNGFKYDRPSKLKV